MLDLQDLGGWLRFVGTDEVVSDGEKVELSEGWVECSWVIELVELITAQRNFQANAKAIETNNTLTQAIINIRG